MLRNPASLLAIYAVGVSHNVWKSPAWQRSLLPDYFVSSLRCVGHTLSQRFATDSPKQLFCICLQELILVTWVRFTLYTSGKTCMAETKSCIICFQKTCSFAPTAVRDSVIQSSPRLFYWLNTHFHPTVTVCTNRTWQSFLSLTKCGGIPHLTWLSVAIRSCWLTTWNKTKGAWRLSLSVHQTQPSGLSPDYRISP